MIDEHRHSGIHYENEAGVALLRVDRPEARNALSWAAQEAFARAVDAASGAAEGGALRVLIITGTGPAFVAGGDLKELAGYGAPADGARLNRIMSRALDRLQQLPAPVIAAINGDAVGGGCEILLACDLRLMAAGARLRFAQGAMGLTTGWGGTARLVRQVGQSRALDLLLTGRAVEAEEAQEIGLIHRIVPPGADTLVEAQAWARELQKWPRDALAALKRLVYATGSRADEAVAAYERTLFVQLWGSENHQEAVRAFLEKRRPRFNQS